MPEAQVPEPLVCPKCGKTRKADEQSCVRCGLTFALWKADTAPPLVNLDAKGAALWEGVRASWGDASLHEDFLKHCLQAGNLAAAGRLYRQWLDDHPGDAIASRMQTQVLTKAALGLSIGKTQPREPVTRNRWFWVIVLTAMALGIAGGLLWRYLR